MHESEAPKWGSTSRFIDECELCFGILTKKNSLELMIVYFSLVLL